MLSFPFREAATCPSASRFPLGCKRIPKGADWPHGAGHLAAGLSSTRDPWQGFPVFQGNGSTCRPCLLQGWDAPRSQKSGKLLTERELLVSVVAGRHGTRSRWRGGQHTALERDLQEHRGALGRGFPSRSWVDPREHSELAHESGQSRMHLLFFFSVKRVTQALVAV